MWLGDTAFASAVDVKVKEKAPTGRETTMQFVVALSGIIQHPRRR